MTVKVKQPKRHPDQPPFITCKWLTPYFLDDDKDEDDQNTCELHKELNELNAAINKLKKKLQEEGVLQDVHVKPAKPQEEIDPERQAFLDYINEVY